MTTKTSIISNAVTLMGHAPILSLIDQDELIVAAEQLFDMKLPSVLSSANWRFATKIEQLSQLVETPPPPYLYVYQLPSGWLKTLQVWPNTYDWDIFNGNKIYAFQDTEWYMQFIYQPDVSQLPPWFVDYFIYEIAAPLALTNAEKTEYFSVLEQKRTSMQALAMSIDCQNRPQFTQVDFPVLGNRFIGGVYPNGLGM
jgi:hypothetical protein